MHEDSIHGLQHRTLKIGHIKDTTHDEERLAWATAVAKAAPAMPLFRKQTRRMSPPRFTTPARAAASRGVTGSMAARKKACVTNINRAAGKPRHLHKMRRH